jgi:hypothetical protein
MPDLTAVHPDWLRVGDHNGKDRKSRGTGSNWHEARLETVGHIGVRHANGDAGVSEVGLGDGVVLTTS